MLEGLLVNIKSTRLTPRPPHGSMTSAFCGRDPGKEKRRKKKRDDKGAFIILWNCMLQKSI